MSHSRAGEDAVPVGLVLTTLTALLCVAAAVNAQEVYRSVDAQGHVVYSDRGTSKNAPKTSLQVNEGDAVEAARIAHEQQQLQAQDAQRSKQQAAEDKAKASADKKHEEACRNARSTYSRMMDARRLSQPQRDADGNRSYYSDEEADALREQARKAMDSACTS